MSFESLGRSRKASIFHRPFVDFSQFKPPPSVMSEDSLKGSSGTPAAKDTSYKSPIDEHPIWEAQLWEVHSTTMQDPAWRLRFKIWLSSPSPCASLHCPTKTPHNQGRYLHEGELCWDIDSPFGRSNPPPDIWEAEARMQGGKNTGEDLEIVEAFMKIPCRPRRFLPNLEERIARRVVRTLWVCSLGHCISVLLATVIKFMSTKLF